MTDVKQEIFKDKILITIKRNPKGELKADIVNIDGLSPDKLEEQKKSAAESELHEGYYSVGGLRLAAVLTTVGAMVSDRSLMCEAGALWKAANLLKKGL